MAGVRAYLSAEARIEDSVLLLDERESHHLRRVLRLQRGAVVTAFDGKGRVWTCEVAGAQGKHLALSIRSSEQHSKPASSLVLLQAVPKQKAFDTILRMATEIGADAIQPVFTHHGEVHLDGSRLAAKADKWRQTMIEACKQCGLAFVPELRPALRLQAWDAAQTATLAGIVASLEDGAEPLAKALEGIPCETPLYLAVGPEGDFSPAEYALLRARGFLPVRLGAQVLRCETAAAYLLSVCDQLR